METVISFFYNNHGRKQQPEVFCKKGVLKKFAKFTGKHYLRSLLFDKVAASKFLRANFL